MRKIIGLTAFLAAVVVLQGCAPGAWVPFREDGALELRYRQHGAMIQPSASTAALPPRTGWYRSADGVFIEEMACQPGARQRVPDPQYPGYYYDRDCRVIAAAPAPAVQAAPPVAYAAPPTAITATPLALGAGSTCGDPLQARAIAVLGARPEPLARCLVTADSSRHTCLDGRAGKRLSSSAADPQYVFAYWDCSPSRNLW